MSYISAIQSKEEVVVWERVNGERVIRHYNTPHYFFIPDPSGTYTSLDGRKLSKMEFSSGYEMRGAVEQCKAEGIDLFESDHPGSLKVLSENYYGVPAPKLHVTFLDIEVDYNRTIGFSSIENPYAEINSVALHHMWIDKTILLVIPPQEYYNQHDQVTQQLIWDEMNVVEPLPDTITPEDIIICDTEMSLLLELIAQLDDSDVMCGWNSDFFDIPYIGRRLQKVLGEKYFRMLTFPGAPAPRWKEIERFNTPHTMLDIDGRISVDYLELFKKYEMAERPSYKLEAISEEILPELKKLEYEGTLAELYRGEWCPSPDTEINDESDKLKQLSVYRERLRHEIKERGLENEI